VRFVLRVTSKALDLALSFKRESSQQHGVLAGKIDKIAEKLDGHIEWHMTKPTRKKKDES